MSAPNNQTAPNHKPDASGTGGSDPQSRPHAAPSGGFTSTPAPGHPAVSGGISPRFPANKDGKGDTPDGIG